MREKTIVPRRHRVERAPRWSDRELAAIKAEHDLEAVAAQHGVTLQASGARFVALCPFHVETHPSFTIFPESQRWWCFGCQRGGDVIEFVRLLEGIGFREAVERLSDSPPMSASAPRRAGRRLLRSAAPTTPGARSPAISPTLLAPESQRALDVAAACYVRELHDSPSARRYLQARGLSEALVRAARLGYCSGSQLRHALRLHGVSVHAGRVVGLFAGHEGDERFTGRITIPEIRDGHTRWLTGRLLNDDTDAPRYLSLPGPRPLYGAERVCGQSAVIGVEGYFDALTLWGWGMPAFAAGGVSLPSDALEVLRAARMIYLAFDQDAPGQEAAHVLARRLGPRLRRVSLPDGVKDVNELGRRQEGEAQFYACLQLAYQQAAQQAAQRERAGQVGQEAA